jgi:5-methylcytosine-specific restriction endonuclease McrA
MKVTKEERQLVFLKYDGRCAYCGCELSKGWHVDHLKPIRRKKYKKEECRYPQRACIDNYMPACASCNINKHAMKLEDFRNLVAGFMKHLNERNTQYKIAKRFGLVIENIQPVVFYFETWEQEKILSKKITGELQKSEVSK